MSKKAAREFSIDVPWGKVAVVAWGDATQKPILLVHGFMDNAATFQLLVDLLPDDYYYVGFDMPGHGKSDPFPPGLLILQLSMVEVIRRVVESLKWEKFIMLAHSLGCIIGIFYNHLFPNKITKMLQLDPGVPMVMYYYVQYHQSYWFNSIYRDYYDNYERWNSNKAKVYSYSEAVDLLVKSRSLSKEQAEVILSRSLVPVTEDLHRLSWDPRMKKIGTILASAETLHHIMTSNVPPTIVVQVSENKTKQPSKDYAKSLLEKCQQVLPHYSIVKIQGGHDIHITHPEVIVPIVVDFLKQNFVPLAIDNKSKL